MSPKTKKDKKPSAENSSTKQKNLKHGKLICFLVIILLTVAASVMAVLFCQKNFYLNKGKNVVCNTAVDKADDPCAAAIKEKDDMIKAKNSDLYEQIGEISKFENKSSILEKLLVALNKQGKQKTTYTNKDLKLSFEYPAYWGEIISEDAGQIFFTFSNFNCDYDSPIVMTNVKPNVEPPGRGGYFGDVGYELKNEDVIKNYCKDKDTCEVFTNKNGITMAKHNFIIATAGGPETDTPTNQYYFYNPNTPNAGVVISPGRLPYRDSIEDFDELFEEFVQSIKFIK